MSMNELDEAEANQHGNSAFDKFLIKRQRCNSVQDAFNNSNSNRSNIRNFC
ncbi:1805_t:CDS:2 [Entrophospora sp. SA101]|nr:1805_t:CDS:2 [Entrophospora sp. SA101]